MLHFFKKILLYTTLFFSLNLGLGYYLKSYESIDLKQAGVFFSDLRWDDFNNLKQPIDALILGSSHAFRSYHPATIQQGINTENTVFNFGSAAQTPVTSYFLLEEVLQKHQPKIVILDLYVMVFTSDDQLNNGRYNFHPMEWGRNKKLFLKDGFNFKEQVKLLAFPTYVYRDHLKHKINKLLGRNYLPIGKGAYEENGFAYNRDTLAIEKLKYDNQFSKFKIQKNQMTAKNLRYTKKIVERCRAAQIPIVFMSSPMPEASVKFIEEYAAISTAFSDLATDLGVPYLDFNQKRTPEIQDQYHYYDDDHMNLAGAKLFSEQVAEFIIPHLKSNK